MMKKPGTIVLRITAAIVTIAILVFSSPILPARAQQGNDQEIAPNLSGGWLEKGNSKLDSRLNQLMSTARNSGQGSFIPQPEGIEEVGNQVRVIIESQTGHQQETIDLAQGLGQVEASYGDLVQVLIPPTALNTLADYATTRFIRLPYTPVLDAVTSEGVALINADDWQNAGYDGSGVKIAILDTGFQGYSSLLGTELPSSVTTYSFRTDGDISGGGQVHGTACAEVVHDVAPGAQLYLVNFDNDLQFGNAVDWLITQGVNIISSSVGWPAVGPGDGTGPIDEIVSRAKAAGILWAQAAGNHAQQHWSGTFTDNGGYGWNNFNTSPTIDEGQTISVTSGQTIGAWLTWNDTWGSSANDYDLYLIDNSDLIVYGSENIQDGGGYPYEGFSYTATYTGTYWIGIYKNDGAGVRQLQLYTTQNLQYQTAAGSIAVPGDSPDAMTVGAIFWNTPTTLESFSSQGPTTDSRIKPDLVAPDGVSTVSHTGAFYGTSAAAPHAAGAAALVKQMYPDYSTAQIQAFLESNTVDLGVAGKDYLFGSGRLRNRTGSEGTFGGGGGSPLFSNEFEPPVYPGSDILDIAVVPNGTTGYIVTGATDVDTLTEGTQVGGFKTVDSGATWDKFVVSGASTVTKITIASDNTSGSFIAVIADNNKEFISTNGGINFSQIAGLTATTIRSIAISPSVDDGTRYLAVAADNAVWLYTNSSSFGGGSGWADIMSSGNVTAGPALAVKFSPNFSSDRTLVVISTDGTNTRLNLFNTATLLWNADYAAYGISNKGTIINSTVATQADIDLPNDYMALDTTLQITYISLNQGGLFRNTTNLTTTPMNSVAVNSNGDKLTAGSISGNAVYIINSPTTATSANVTMSIKLPSASISNLVSVDFFGPYIGTGTVGTESAFALSTDGGTSFNDVAFIDTVTVIKDFTVSPDAARCYLVTENAGVTSLWRKNTNWERIFKVAGTDYIVRTVPGNTDQVFMADTGSTSIWFSSDAGQTVWLPRVANETITDLAVDSADILYVLTGTSVSKSTDNGIQWDNPMVVTGAGTGTSITLTSAGNLLVTGSDGVAYSTDGAAHWTKVGAQIPGGGRTLAVASGLGTGDFIYASSTGATDVYRWEIGTSNTWTPMWELTLAQIGNPTGLSLSGDILYLTTDDGTQSYLYRTALSGTAALTTQWNSFGPLLDILSAGASPASPYVLRFIDTPQGLSVTDNSSYPRIWALSIDLTTPRYLLESAIDNQVSAPTDIILSGSSIPENQPVSTVIGILSSTDSTTGDTFTYTLVAGAGDDNNTQFNISGNNLRTSAIFDYETKNSYNIRLRSTDSSALYYEKSFTITVTLVSSGGGSPGGSLGGGGFSSGGGGGVASGPGVTSLSPYVSFDGHFNLAAVVKSEDSKVSMIIAKGILALGKDTYPLKSIKIVPVDSPLAAPQGSHIIGLVYEITPEGATFSPAIPLSLFYDPSGLPANINPNSLNIAFYNTTTSSWELLDSVRSSADSSVTADIGHFSIYTIIGQETKVVVPTTQPAPAPASFTISELSVKPSIVQPGEEVTVSAKVSNSGGSSGEYEVVLKINGIAGEIKKLSLSPDTSTTVTFTLKHQDSGSYAVDVNGLASSFIVSQPQPTFTPLLEQQTDVPSGKEGLNWPLVLSIAGGVVVIAMIVVLVVVRQKKH